MAKTEQEREAAQLRREAALLRYRREQRARDLFCGDGVVGGRYYCCHGFHRGKEPLGPVAKADLDRGPADLVEETVEETDDE